MKPYFLIILSVIIFISSCKKEDAKLDRYAGIYEVDMELTELSPSLKFNYVVDTLTNTKSGSDSIDINSDGKYDLFIQQRIFNNRNDSLQLDNDNYPYCSMTMKNRLELAITTETIYVGLGQTADIYWVDTLSYSDEIYKYREWSNLINGLWVWVKPPTTVWGTYGCWYTTSEEDRYIGFRMFIDAEYKSGWIRVRQPSLEEFEIISYCIEK